VPSVLGVDGMDAKVTFRTPAIATAYTALGTYIALGEDLSIVLYYAKMLSGGIDAESGHLGITCELGLVALEGITAGKRGPALIEYTLYPISDDGVNASVSIASAELPDLVVLEELYKLGPGRIGSGKIEVSDVSLKPNSAIFVDSHSGQVYNTIAAIKKSPAAVMSFNTNDMAVIETVTPTGVIVATPGFWLRQIDVATGLPVAETSETHILVAMTSGLARPGRLSGEHQVEQRFDVQISAVYDGENDPFVVDTTAKISAA
jgi:hypothetical protein